MIKFLLGLWLGASIGFVVGGIFVMEDWHEALHIERLHGV